MKASLIFTLSAAVLAAGAASVSAQPQNTPVDLGDLVGARAAGGETQMQARGYRYLRTNTVNGAKWSLWWSDDRRTCVQVATYDGRYSTINRVPAANCGQNDGRRPGYGDNDRNDRTADDRPGYGNDDGYGDRRGRGDDRGGYGDDYRGGDGSLTLICYGEGRKPGAQYRSGYEWNPRTHRYESRLRVENGSVGFDSEVQVEVFRGRGRIHLTGKLVAPINSGGRNGWWDLQELRVDQYRITGSYRLNGLNKPRVDIDRRSGRIRIDGIEHFRGECDVGNWGDNSTRF